MFIIYIWPDGMWVPEDEYDETTYRFAGDDFYSLEVPPEVDDIDDWLTERNLEVYLGEACETRTRE